MARTALVQSTTPTVQPLVNPTASRAATPTTATAHTRPTYKSPYIQALSD